MNIFLLNTIFISSINNTEVIMANINTKYLGLILAVLANTVQKLLRRGDNRLVLFNRFVTPDINIDKMQVLYK